MVLLRVQLDDELLLNLCIDLGPDRERVDQDTHLVRDHFDPRGRLALASLRPRYHERCHLHGLGCNVDDVALPDPVRRDVHLPPIDQEVAVRHQLAGHVPTLRETGPVNHVVQAALQDLEQVLAGLAALARGLLVVAMELALKDSVDPACLLLLPDLKQVLALLGPVPAVLTRWVRPDLDGALGRIALGPLQEELHLLAAAELAVRARVSSHLSLYSSDPAPLRRAAAIMRNRGDVLNGSHLKAGRLQRTDSGLPPRARALDEDVDFAHPVLHGATCGSLRRHLRGERCRFARSLEADLARGSPRNDVADRIGERAPDVGVPMSDVLPFFAAHLLGAGTALRRHLLPAPGGRRIAVSRELLLAGLLLAGHCLLPALAGTRVRLGALAMDWQPAPMTDSLVAPDLHLAADVGLHLAAQVSFYLVGGFDPVTEADKIVVPQVVDSCIATHARRFQRLERAGPADPVNVCESDLQPLFAGEVNTNQSSHLRAVLLHVEEVVHTASPPLPG